jgi:UDP-3-O-[3-hydroxymyristoyl] glucosamine N-acyltransferase
VRGAVSVLVHPSAVVEGEVGKGSVVGPGAYVGATATIGRNCRIGPGAVIGSEGFGYERDGDGRWVQKMSRFGVEIGDDVHIGANVCVDRGSWRDTEIMKGCRIDNLVHIAHNVVLHANVVVVAQAMVAGSVEVGVGAWIGPAASVIQRITVGHGALVGMGAVVTRDVDPDVTVVGSPARVIDAEQGVREEM